jgi:hypothetical protein
MTASIPHNLPAESASLKPKRGDSSLHADGVVLGYGAARQTLDEAFLVSRKVFAFVMNHDSGPYSNFLRVKAVSASP